MSRGPIGRRWRAGPAEGTGTKGATMAPDSALDAIRDEAGAFVDANWDLDLTVAEWWERLAASGWAFPTWPTEWFGKGLGNDALGAIDSVFRDRRALGAPGGLGQMMGGPVLMRHG